MSEENEDYDELPPITVASARDSSSFSMPSAAELASQRAREEQCEAEIRRLREDHAQATENIVAACMTRSDSSESESEAMLVAATESGLRVRSASDVDDAPKLETLLSSLRPHVPDPSFLDAYLDAVRTHPHRSAQSLVHDLMQKISGMLQASLNTQDQWETEEAIAVGAWLCAAVVSREGRDARLRVARVTHLLLDDVATQLQTAALGAVLVSGVREARLRIELCDALRSGGTRAGTLAHSLLLAALADLLGDRALYTDGCGGAVSRWRRLSARDQYVALQALGRAIASSTGQGEGQGEGEGQRAGEGLLVALSNAMPHAHSLQPDALKVLVTASKLQVLFRVKK